jgi:hypothetical protein
VAAQPAALTSSKTSRADRTAPYALSRNISPARMLGSPGRADGFAAQLSVAVSDALNSRAVTLEVFLFGKRQQRMRDEDAGRLRQGVGVLHPASGSRPRLASVYDYDGERMHLLPWDGGPPQLHRPEALSAPARLTAEGLSKVVVTTVEAAQVRLALALPMLPRSTAEGSSERLLAALQAAVARDVRVMLRFCGSGSFDLPPQYDGPPGAWYSHDDVRALLPGADVNGRAFFYDGCVDGSCVLTERTGWLLPREVRLDWEIPLPTEAQLSLVDLQRKSSSYLDPDGYSVEDLLPELARRELWLSSYGTFGPLGREDAARVAADFKSVGHVYDPQELNEADFDALHLLEEQGKFPLTRIELTERGLADSPLAPLALRRLRQRSEPPSLPLHLMEEAWLAAAEIRLSTLAPHLVEECWGHDSSSPDDTRYDVPMDRLVGDARPTRSATPSRSDASPAGRPHLIDPFGTVMRSKSELLIAGVLMASGLEYRYEQPYTDKRGRIKALPDFTIKCPNGRDIIWEHLGMLDQHAYAEAWERKRGIYELDGWELGVDLFLTDERDGFDMTEIMAIVKRIVVLGARS